MVTLAVGSVVTVRFPFSNLSGSKMRPALVLADAGNGDWVLCQITSNAYADASAIQIQEEDFANGSLHRISYARPGKLFTAHETLMGSHIGQLNDDSFRKIANTVVRFLQSNIPR